MQSSKLQRMGGIAALLEAVTFVVGFVLFFTLIADADYGNLDVAPAEHVAFLVDNEAVMYAWNLIIYVAFGVLLVVLVLALHERLKERAPVWSQIAAAFGLIWSGLVIASGMVANIGAAVVIDLAEANPTQAESTWLSLHFVTDGLGGGNEIVGGVWVLLLSWAALQTNELRKGLNILGLVVGAAGVISLVPALGEILGAIFGLGLIVWFIWLGIVMLSDMSVRQDASTSTATMAPERV